MIRLLYPEIDGPLRRLTGDRLYAAYKLPWADVVAGRLEDDPRPAIEDAGYDRARVFAARKRHPRGDVYDLGSYRRVPVVHPKKPRVRGTELLDRFSPIECQYHVHVWWIPGEETWDVACHYEPSSRLLHPLSGARERLAEHLHPEWGETKILGVMDPRLDLI